MAGLTPAGFEPKSLADVLADLEADLRSAVSPNIDLSPESPNGQLVGVLAGQIRKLWELGQALYASQYPDTASGFSLDSLAALTGTTRDGATPSLVDCTVDLDAGVYLRGALIAVVDGDPLARFFNSLDITSPGGVLTGQAFESENTGPVRANAGTLTIIAEAVAGWNSVTNPLDAALGADVESDASLRAKRERQLARRGATSVDAIRADLLAVDGVTSVTVLENETDITDVNGLPPHSVEAIVRGGTDADVAAALFASKAAGIQTYAGGTVVSETVTDSMGVDHTVLFSRPTVVDIYLDIFLTVDALAYGGDAAVKTALVDYGDVNYAVGGDVVLSRLVAAIFAEVPGVVDVTSIEAGTAPSPTGTVNIAIGLRQLADLDTSRITVTTAV